MEANEDAVIAAVDFLEEGNDGDGSKPWMWTIHDWGNVLTGVSHSMSLAK